MSYERGIRSKKHTRRIHPVDRSSTGSRGRFRPGPNVSRAVRVEKQAREITFHETRQKNPESLDNARALLKKIHAWLQNRGVEIQKAKRLGGGYVNPVLLLETTRGDRLVAKSFQDPRAAEISRDAQKILHEVADENEEIFPSVVGWVDHETLLSKVADGHPLRHFIAEIAENEGNPESLKDAEFAFGMIGRLLKGLHEKTRKDSTDPDLDIEDLKSDAEKISIYIRETLSLYVDLDALGFDIDGVERELGQVTWLPDEVSITHSDPHADQFFVSKVNEGVSIVDYDTLRYADPALDVGRMIGSIRHTAFKYGLPREQTKRIKNAFLDGYSVGNDDLGHRDAVPQQRAQAYEMRFYLAALWVARKDLAIIEQAIPRIQTTAGEFIKTPQDVLFGLRDGVITDESLRNAGLTADQVKKIDNIDWLLDQSLDFLHYFDPNKGIEE